MAIVQKIDYIFINWVEDQCTNILPVAFSVLTEGREKTFLKKISTISQK